MKKVLLIDDSVTIHRVIDLSIDSERFDIVKVFSSEDAALKMGEQAFDFILLDNKLDNVSIWQYVKELKSLQNSAKIILLVGAFDKFDSADLEKTLADDYLVKPFDSQSLNAKLNDEVQRGESDVMSTGFVERIPEADEKREYNDPDSVPAPLTGSAVVHDAVQEETISQNDADEFADVELADDPDIIPGEEQPEPALPIVTEDVALIEEATENDEPAPINEPEEEIIEETAIDIPLEKIDDMPIETAEDTVAISPEEEEEPQADDDSCSNDDSTATADELEDSIFDDTLNAILEEPDQFDDDILNFIESNVEPDIEPHDIEPVTQDAPAEPIKPAPISSGGVSISISREELMAMVGSAIDKKLLESVIKDLLAKNISEIIREIVPALAEKYIKEEIQRLKEDE